MSTKQKDCVRCGTAFSCGAEDAAAPCWCAALPRVMPLSGADCLCPACLRAEIDKVIALAGRCADCAHARRLTTKRGATIFQCGMAEKDARFVKFPRLPMARCDGHALK